MHGNPGSHGSGVWLGADHSPTPPAPFDPCARRLEILSKDHRMGDGFLVRIAEAALAPRRNRPAHAGRDRTCGRGAVATPWRRRSPGHVALAQYACDVALAGCTQIPTRLGRCSDQPSADNTRRKAAVSQRRKPASRATVYMDLEPVADDVASLIATPLIH